jgi:hypothetical protein
MNNLWWPTSGAVLTSYSPKSCCSEVLFALKADLVKYISYIHHGDLNTEIGVLSCYYLPMAYTHGSAYGYQAKGCRCEICTEGHRVRQKKYRATPHGRAAIMRKNKAYNKRYPERRRAWHKVYKALKNGTLVKPDKCEDCDREVKLDASHHDYEKPLDVRWLCRQCHTNLDRPTSIRNGFA